MNNNYKKENNHKPVIIALVSVVVVLLSVFLGQRDINKDRKKDSNLQAMAAIKNVKNFNSDFYDVSDVVTEALEFKALLTTAEQSTLEQTYTSELAGRWSNLPCGSSCRNGIAFEDLTSSELTAALEVIIAALGTGTNNGYEEFNGIRVAEDYLDANDGSGSTNYYYGLTWIAFLNTPSSTGSWMLQFGGHHYAANIAFNNGHVIGATPFFVAIEPKTFTLDGTYYAPMEDEKEAFQEMLASLSSSEFNTAKLSETFSDCLMSPGESNGNSNTFPSTKEGIQCSSLTTSQKNLVLAAIENYVSDLDETTAASIMTLYTDEIDDTYIAFTGSATVGDASTFLTSNTNYVRIDGPSVWIEFACQNGIVLSGIHYHSVWRDHESDYGNDLSGDAIDTLDAEEFELGSVSLYPIPSQTTVNIKLKNPVNNASVYIYDISGKRVSASKNHSGNSIDVNIETLSKGNYIIKLEDENKKTFTSKFVKN